MGTETATTTKWTIDPAHSQVQFKVKHLMISTITGSFRDFGADAELEGETLEGAHVRFWANTASVDTGAADRDKHLRGADFFDAEKFPKLTFESTGIEKAGSGWKVTGDLTMRGVTKPVTLNTEWTGIAKDPWGNSKAGVILEGKIDRKQWGLNWNAALETGGMLVSEEVRIHAEVQFAMKG